MSGIFGKVGILVKAHTNDLLNKAIDMDSPSVVAQYIRELEKNLDDTKHQAAVAAANVKSIERQIAVEKAAIQTSTTRAQAFLAQNDNTNARNEAVKINTSKGHLAQFTQDLAEAQTNSIQLDNAVQTVQTKHDQMVNQLNMLRNKDRSSKALNATTKSLQNVSKILSDVDGVNVDNLQDRLDRQHDVAVEEFNRTVGGMTPAKDPLQEQTVDDILNSLRTPEPAAV